MDEQAARVLAVVRRIPPGRVLTYGDVAALAAGDATARDVGQVLLCLLYTSPSPRDS